MGKTLSVKFTCILTKILFICLVVAVFFIPSFAKWYDKVSSQESICIPLCICLYITCIPAFILLFNLHKVLSNIKMGTVFSKDTVLRLRILSYCCFFVSVFWMPLAYLRPLLIIVSAVAAIMGLILRVLKNVFDGAVQLKDENDYTI